MTGDLAARLDTCPGGRLLPQQCRQFVAARGTRLGHCTIDMAVDGSDRENQLLGDFTPGQPLSEQPHDLAFTVGEWQRLAGPAQRRGAHAALLRKRVSAYRAFQGQPAHFAATVDQGRMRSGIHRGNEIANPLELI